MDRQQTLLASRIIAAAIPFGAAVFLCVVFFLHNGSEEFGTGKGTLASMMISVVPALFALMAYPLIPRLIAKSIPDPFAAFRTILILRLALCEFAALLGCVAFMLEGKDTPVGGGVAVAMNLFMAAQFPTAARLDTFVERWPHG